MLARIAQRPPYISFQSFYMATGAMLVYNAQQPFADKLGVTPSPPTFFVSGAYQKSSGLSLTTLIWRPIIGRILHPANVPNI